VNHLINHRLGGPTPNKVQLGFEVNLRKYQCGTSFQAEEPFLFPRTKDFKAVEADRSAFPPVGPFSPSKKTLLESPTHEQSIYNDQFKLRNM
jgi:hypothetical protein